MKKFFFLFVCFAFLFFLIGCEKNMGKVASGESLPENGSALLPEQFQKLAKNPERTLIDIRNEREMKEFGVIPGTDLQKNVYDEKAVKYLENMDPAGKYLIYCFHGNRSFYLKEHLIKDLGFQHVYDLEGGIDKWSEEGYGTGG